MDRIKDRIRKGWSVRGLLMLVIIAIILVMVINAVAHAQQGSGFPPCPRPNKPLAQWTQGEAKAWQDCVEGSSAAALNQVVSYGAAISQLARGNEELRASLRAEQRAREQLSARLDAVAASKGGPATAESIQDAVWQLFFAQGGKDWQHLIIGTAEEDWQTRHRPWAADFVKERGCQMVRAGLLAPGPVVCP